MKKKSIVISLVLSVCLLIPGQAFAYTTKEYKMASQMWYQPHKVFTETSKEAMRTGMATWNMFLPEYRRLCFNWTTHSDSGYPKRDNKNYIYKEYMNSTSTLAENYAWWDANGVLLESDINVNSSQPWANGYYQDRYDVGSVMLHEEGHTLGLDHSTDRKASMYPTFDLGELRGYSDDDINGIRAIYGTTSPNAALDTEKAFDSLGLIADDKKVGDYQVFQTRSPLMKAMSISEIADESEVIVAATVESCGESFYISPSNGADPQCFTDITLSINHVFFGDESVVEKDCVTLRLPIGLGDKIAFFDDSIPNLQEGDSAVFFLTRYYSGVDYDLPGNQYYLTARNQSVWFEDSDGSYINPWTEQTSESFLQDIESYGENNDPIQRIQELQEWKNDYAANLAKQKETGFISEDGIDESLSQIEAFSKAPSKIMTKIEAQIYENRVTADLA